MSVGGGGLYKPAEAYQIGEICQVRFWFSDKPSTRGLDELPEEIKGIIDVKRVFQNLSWESGRLKFDGRMSYSLRNELQEPSKDKNYRRAIETLYRYSNQFMAETVDTEWCQRVGNKYPVGTHIPEARVLNLASFGAFIELEPGVRGLVPNSEMIRGSASSVEDNIEVGGLVAVRVMKVDCEKRQIGLSMKMAGNEPAAKYHVHDRVSGRVTGVRNFGAFVEIEPGFSGLLHKDEMWGKVFDATKVISIGVEVEVLILSIDPKVSFSMRQIEENNPLLKYQAGFSTKGKVTEVKDFGAFVEIELGVSGMIHKSKMGKFVSDARNVLKVGDEVNVVVLSVDIQRQNLSFNMQI